MKLMCMEWECPYTEDIIQAFENRKIEIVRVPFSEKFGIQNKEYETNLKQFIEDESPDFLFSFGFHPLVSNVCDQCGQKYVAWVYQFPDFSLYSATVMHSCNYILIADEAQWLELKSNGLSRVYYLPLAANVNRIEQMIQGLEAEGDREEKYKTITYIGSLYTEKENNPYDRIEGLELHTKGYLEGIMECQLQLPSVNIISEILKNPLLEELMKRCPLEPEKDSMISAKELYVEKVMNTKITSLERIRILNDISDKYTLDLYTQDSSYEKTGVKNHGAIEYLKQLPKVVHTTKYNLYLQGRYKKNGLPFTVWDTIAARGFLCASHSQELLKYFVPGEDFLYVQDAEQLCDRIAFYECHEEERKSMIENAYAKLLASHTYESRVERMLQYIQK